MPEESTGAVKSAVRVLDVFELLARGEELTHADIAGALGIPKSSLTQLLRTLVARGYIDFSVTSKGYQLGAAFSQLSRRAGEARDLIAFVQPVLEEITRETGETSALNQQKGNQAEVVATVASPQRLVSNMHCGDLAPLYATSGGKCILAQMPDAIRDDYVAGVAFEPITAKTIRSKRALLRQIAAARRDGVAWSFEEFTPGIVGIGVPVFSAAGFPLGALNVAIPAVRCSEAAKECAIAALQRAAARIRRHFIGGDAPQAARRRAPR